jgi:hypothetical protein
MDTNKDPGPRERLRLALERLRKEQQEEEDRKERRRKKEMESGYYHDLPDLGPSR